MLEQSLLDDIRAELISELQRSIEIYGPSWINKKECEELIQGLKDKQPVRIGYLLYGDILDGVLSEHNLRRAPHGTQSSTYEAIWDAIEQGQ